MDNIKFDWTLESAEKWIQTVTQKFAKNHILKPYDIEDLTQFVRLRYTEKLPVIQENFRGDAKIRTYLFSVTLNFCREFMRKNHSKSIFTEPAEISQEISNLEEKDHYIIKDLHINMELERLNYIFTILGTKTPKIILALKVYFGIALDKNDIQKYTQQMKLSLTFISLYKELNLDRKESVFSFLTKLFNETEQKEGSADGTRKWFERNMKMIINLLNKEDKKTHTKETLSTLMDIKYKRW